MEEFHDSLTWEEETFCDTQEAPEMEEEEEMPPPPMERTPRVTSFESKVNELMTHHQLVGKSSTFDTMAFAISTVEKLQNLEAL